MKGGQAMPPVELPAPGEAHLWSVDLDLAPAEELENDIALLSPDEERRATRLAFSIDRSRFIVCRALLRRALAAYIGADPRAITFTCNPWNKPQLSADLPDLRFNISHSGGLALLAFASGVEVGVDIEHINRRIGVLELAQDCFSAAEQAALRRLPEAMLLEAFFACWSRKEAYIKARGMGLWMDLRAFDVSLDAAAECWSLSEAGVDTTAAWSLFNCRPATGVAGALAVAAPGMTMQKFRWDWAAKTAQPSHANATL